MSFSSSSSASPSKSPDRRPWISPSFNYFFRLLLSFILCFTALLTYQWYSFNNHVAEPIRMSIQLYKFKSTSHMIASTKDEIVTIFATKNLTCKGWRETIDCNGHGAIRSNKTKSCMTVISPNESGYCEFVEEATGKLYNIGARDCNTERKPFSCFNILYDVAPDVFDTVNNITDAKELVEQPFMKCQGFLGASGFQPYTIRDPKKDKLCSETVPGYTAGFCIYKNILTNTMYRIMPKNASSFMVRCENITVHHPFFERKDYVHIPLGDSEKMTSIPLQKLKCIAFYGLAKYGGLRSFGADRPCNSGINLPANGWCEYEFEGKYYRAFLNETNLNKKVMCSEISDWHKEKHVFVSGLSEIEKVLEEKPLLKCLHGRRTNSCGPKESTMSVLHDCNTLMHSEYSGFCEYYDNSTYTYYALAPFECHYMRHLRCSYIPRMVRFKNDLNKLVHNLHRTNGTDKKRYMPGIGLPLPNGKKAVNEKPRGIIICIYPKIWIQAYALLRLLNSYQTKLPVELWSLENEWSNDTNKIESLLESYEHGSITLRYANLSQYIKHKPVDNQERMTQGYLIKIYAVLNTNFNEILVLDADNYPTRNPEYLFMLEEYKTNGAIFWPDYWHFQNSMFVRLDTGSYLWDMLDMPYVDMAEQESGQILINRKVSEGALRILDFFLMNYELLYVFLWGDKDFYRFSWLKYKQSFHMIQSRPASAGIMTNKYYEKRKKMYPWTLDEKTQLEFCGLSMVQFNPDDSIAFFHRNGGKFKEDSDYEYIWQYLQIYDLPGYGEVTYYGPCYQYAGKSTIKKISETTFPDLEKNLMSYAKQALEMEELQFNVTSWDSVPEYFLPDMKEYERIGIAVEIGYRRMASSDLVMCALIRNSDIPFQSMISTIETTGKYFKSYKVVLLEDGSTDNTGAIAREWQKRNSNVHFVPLNSSVSSISPKLMGDVSDARILQMSKLRSQLLEYCRSFSHDYMAVFDGDLSNGWSVDGIASSIGLLPNVEDNDNLEDPFVGKYGIPWDIVCSNAVTKDQGGRYYDSLAFRGNGITAGNFRSMEHVFIKKTMPPFPLQSCFGGLALYRANITEGCDYMPPNKTALCEHENLHDCVRRRKNEVHGEDLLLLLNPYQVVNYKIKN